MFIQIAHVCLCNPGEFGGKGYGLQSFAFPILGNQLVQSVFFCSETEVGRALKRERAKTEKQCGDGFDGHKIAK